MNWFLYFTISFLISSVCAGLFFWRNKKSGNKKNMRLGGAGIIIGFIITVLLSRELVLTSQIKALLIGSAFILIIGILDDFKNFSWKKQLISQIILLAILIFFDYKVDYIASPFAMRLDFWLINFGGYVLSVFGIIFLAAWILGIMNAVNWADGIDGLLGGIGILGGFSIFIASLRPEVNQPAVAILSLIFMGAILGFWMFNIPQAKLIAGTSGSYFIGFTLAALSVMAGTKIATALIVLSVPIVDAVWVVLERWKSNSPITLKDQRHLHHKLRRMGWGNGKIASAYLAFIAIMVTFSLFFGTKTHKAMIVLFEAVAVIVFLFYLHVQKKV